MFTAPGQERLGSAGRAPAVRARALNGTARAAHRRRQSDAVHSDSDSDSDSDSNIHNHNHNHNNHKNNNNEHNDNNNRNTTTTTNLQQPQLDGHRRRQPLGRRPDLDLIPNPEWLSAMPLRRGNAPPFGGSFT